MLFHKLLRQVYRSGEEQTRADLGECLSTSASDRVEKPATLLRWPRDACHNRLRHALDYP
jgi:hypothetical protein